MKALALHQTKLIEYVLSALIAVNLFFTITWLSPESEIRTRILEPVRQCMLFWGLEQNWHLFSPVVKNINFHTVAVMTFEDGYRLSWELPRMSRLNYFERFRDEKFRKLCVDSLPWPDYKEFWPDFAKYMGRKFYNKANKPVSLSLQLFWIDIPKPDSRKDGSIVPVSALPEHTNINTVLFYRYSGADLQ